MNKPPENTEAELNDDLVLSRDPRLFRHEKVYCALLARIQEYAKGKELRPTETCRCSYYPLAELVTLACEGKMFNDCDFHSPEALAAKLTDYLWEEVVRIYQQTNS